MRPPTVFAYRQLLGRRRIRMTVQNPEDRAQLQREAGLTSVLIRGAGVDLGRFKPSSVPTGTVTVVLALQMLWEEVLQESVDAGGCYGIRDATHAFFWSGRLMWAIRPRCRSLNSNLGMSST